MEYCRMDMEEDMRIIPQAEFVQDTDGGHADDTLGDGVWAGYISAHGPPVPSYGTASMRIGSSKLS
jgi:hypothetical protein